MLPDTALWTATFDALPPLGWVLRKALPERWLRIHSLPSGQRYPSGANDLRTLLARHNAVATAVLGPGAGIVVFAARHSLAAHRPLPACLRALTFQMAESVPIFPIEASDDADEPGFLSFTAARAVWVAGAFDAIIEAIAQDTLADVVFFSVRTRQVYAPYDGGADLVLVDRASRDQARHTHHAWLSDRADGL